MEAEAQRWNQDTDFDEGTKKRKRKEGEQGQKKTRDDQLIVFGELPPSVVDTGSMIKDGHPALNPYLRNKLSMSLGGTQWEETGFEEYQLNEMERLQEKTTATTDEEQLDLFKNSFIQNRKNYEAVRERARSELEKEGVNWSAYDQYAKSLSA